MATTGDGVARPERPRASRLGLLLLLAVAALFGCETSSQGAGAQSVPGAGASWSEEFVGPFPSWTDVKRRYGATGDGTADDTRAIQRGLDDLGEAGPVLFLPAGRYRLTGTLTLNDKLNVSVVGEDPATVALVWDGPQGGAMFRVNGVAYSRFTRLTFDGSGRASVGIEQSWDGKTGNFDTGNEYADDVFTDVEYGIRGGFQGGGFAETSVVRSRFLRNTKAGIALGNFNALDLWVWYSVFDRCGIGVTNDPGAGNFRVYSSVFHNSTVADLFMQNTGLFSARGNYSAGSWAFFTSVAPISHPASIDIQSNTVLDPKVSPVIRLGNQGPGLMMDNVIRSLPDATGPIVQWRGGTDADLVTVGNTFTVARPVAANGRLVRIDDREVSADSLDPPEPRLPGTPPGLGRDVFEVPPGADGDVIQQAIDAAAAKNGRRPVVHIPFGTHAVSRTLTVPPGDVQLVGDGFGSVLRWAGEGDGPVLRVIGPTTVTLRELRVVGSATADGIVIDGIDQPGARAYLEGVQLRGGEQTNLVVRDLTHAEVELVDVGHANMPRGVSVRVSGAKATIFSGASSGNDLSYEFSDGADVLLRDLWYEAGTPRGFASVHGNVSVTMQGLRAATPPTKLPAFQIADLAGEVAILTSHIDDRISVAGDGSRAALLGLGILQEYRESTYFTDASAPHALAVLLNARQRSKTQGRFSPGTVPVPDIGVIDAPFLRRLLRRTRETIAPSPLTARPAGVSDVRMFRVWADSGLNNVTLTGLEGR